MPEIAIIRVSLYLLSDVFIITYVSIADNNCFADCNFVMLFNTSVDNI